MRYAAVLDERNGLDHASPLNAEERKHEQQTGGEIERAGNDAEHAGSTLARLAFGDVDYLRPRKQFVNRNVEQRSNIHKRIEPRVSPARLPFRNGGSRHIELFGKLLLREPASPSQALQRFAEFLSLFHAPIMPERANSARHDSCRRDDLRFLSFECEMRAFRN